MTDKKLTIGISSGDINGIGLEVAIKVLSDKRLLDWCIPVIYASTKVVSYHKNIAKVRDFSFHNASSVESINPQAVNVINCWMENVKITLGQTTADGGKYATFSLEQATEDLRLGHLDALVTAPINKAAMQISGFEFPGHTEYLTHKFQAPENLMLLVNESLRVGLVTNHLPLGKVAETITKELILKKIELMAESLQMDFGIDRPAIAVLGLNPHAGDGGVLGSEEQDVIIPAIKAAKKKGILAIGPYSADGFFGSGNYLNFDGILAMYHDQGLVPFKALSFGKGINFTAGLPIIRTSPDHGTGFDIAGKNMADPQSFREAFYLALDSARQRVAYKLMTKNPIQEVVVIENDEAKDKSPTEEQKSKKNHHKKEQRAKPPRSNNKNKQHKAATAPKSNNKEKSIEERANQNAEKPAEQTTPENNQQLPVADPIELSVQKTKQEVTQPAPVAALASVTTEQPLPKEPIKGTESVKEDIDVIQKVAPAPEEPIKGTESVKEDIDVIQKVVPAPEELPIDAPTVQEKTDTPPTE
ncbi:MAG: 4-hydroxythreonine-4-phosphate dehydrogenase PdxA [Aureispira sp.]